MQLDYTTILPQMKILMNWSGEVQKVLCIDLLWKVQPVYIKYLCILFVNNVYIKFIFSHANLGYLNHSTARM